MEKERKRGSVGTRGKGMKVRGRDEIREGEWRGGGRFASLALGDGRPCVCNLNTNF